MISKELLSEVLGKEVINFNNTGSTLLYNYYILEGMDNHKRPKGDKINLYELAHKCKEWALTQDFSIKTTYDFTHTCFASVYGLQRGAYYNIQSDTEPEAIFKACDYILKEKGRKQNDRHN